MKDGWRRRIYAGREEIDRGASTPSHDQAEVRGATEGRPVGTSRSNRKTPPPISRDSNVENKATRPVPTNARSDVEDVRRAGTEPRPAQMAQPHRAAQKSSRTTSPPVSRGSRVENKAVLPVPTNVRSKLDGTGQGAALPRPPQTTQPRRENQRSNQITQPPLPKDPDVETRTRRPDRAKGRSELNGIRQEAPPPRPEQTVQPRREAQRPNRGPQPPLPKAPAVESKTGHTVRTKGRSELDGTGQGVVPPRPAQMMPPLRADRRSNRTTPPSVPKEQGIETTTARAASTIGQSDRPSRTDQRSSRKTPPPVPKEPGIENTTARAAPTTGRSDRPLHADQRSNRTTPPPVSREPGIENTTGRPAPTDGQSDRPKSAAMRVSGERARGRSALPAWTPPKDLWSTTTCSVDRSRNRARARIGPEL